MKCFFFFSFSDFILYSIQRSCKWSWSFRTYIYVIQFNVVSKQWNWYARALVIKRSNEEINSTNENSPNTHCWLRTMIPFAPSRRGKKHKRNIFERRKKTRRARFACTLNSVIWWHEFSLVFVVAVAQPSTASHGFVYFSFTLLESNGMCVENRISVKEFHRICFIAKKLHVGRARTPAQLPSCLRLCTKQYFLGKE